MVGKISGELREKQSKQLKREFENLLSKKSKKGKSAAVFSLREKILGKKKAPEEPTAIINPNNNEIVFKPSEILRLSVEHCQKLLKNNEPKDDFRDDLE